MWLNKNYQKNNTGFGLYQFVLRLCVIFFTIAGLAILILLIPIIWKDYFSFQNLGSLGAMFGGFVTPFVAIVAVLLTFLAFYVQYTANLEIQKQFKFQKTAEHFYKMLDIHIANVVGLEMDTYRLKDDDVQFSIEEKAHENFTKAVNFGWSLSEIPQLWDKASTKNILNRYKVFDISSKKNNSIKEVVKGRRVFLLLEKDFHFGLYLVKRINTKYLNKRLTDEQTYTLSYRIFFWGVDSLHIHNPNIDGKDVLFISNYLKIIRNNFRRNKGAKYNFKYKTHEGNREVTLRFIPFSGHASRLAHYYRHLYQTVTFLHKSFEESLISELEMETNLKTLRAQFMNEEVLLLYYNYFCGFGKNWSQLGAHNYPFFTDYGLIHNIPLYDVIPEMIENPENHFKKYISEKRKIDPNFKMFEWS